MTHSDDEVRAAADRLRDPMPPLNLQAVLGDPPTAGMAEPWRLTNLRPRPGADELGHLDVLVVLDVDGVILRQPSRPNVEHPQLEDSAGRVFDLDVVERVVELSEVLYRPGVDFCFSTSWAGADPSDLDVLLGRLPEQSLHGGWVLAGEEASGSLSRWKVEAVRAVEAELSPRVALVWIDDQLRQLVMLDPEWASDTTRDRLLIDTHASSGLLPGDLRRIAEFVDAHSAPAPN